MIIREAIRLLSFSIGRVSAVFYELAVVAFIQGACAALIFFALVEHCDEAVTLFKLVSVVFLVAGLVLIGATHVDAQAAFPARCLIVLWFSLLVSVLVFSVKGAFIAFVGSNINRYGSLVSTPYHWRDLALYIPVYFLVIFVAAKGRRLCSRSNGTHNGELNVRTPTDTDNALIAPPMSPKVPMKN